MSGLLSRHDDLASRLARVEEGAADKRLTEYIATRIDILKIAAATLGELGFEEETVGVYDIVQTAAYLAGDEVQ